MQVMLNLSEKKFLAKTLFGFLMETKIQTDTELHPSFKNWNQLLLS